MQNDSSEEKRQSVGHRVHRYYAGKIARKYEATDPRRTNWENSAVSLKASMAKFTAGLDLPFRSIALLVGTWAILEIGWPILIVLGVATAGSVWSIPTTVPCLFIATYATLLINATNVVRTLVIELGNRRDNLVKALFRGYFWSLLSIGIVFVVHTYFRTHLPLLFLLPILYFIPIESSVLGTGVTIPIPVLLGISGLYMDMIVTIIIYVIGVTGACIGGIEILRYLMNASKKHGTYGVIFNVLLLAVFPAMNIYFSLIFLEYTLDLFGRCLTFGA